MKGPAPTPTHLKLLRGNPGQRNLSNRREPMPALPTKPPEPPKYLIGFAREEWERIIVECYHVKLVT